MARVARYFAYGLLGLLVLVVAAAFVLPRLLDRPRIASQIQAKLSSAVKGEVRWSEFRVRMLPAPHGVVRDLRIETGAATLTAEGVTAALRLWPLLTGSAEITSLEVQRPVLRLTVVPAATIPKEAQLAPSEDALQTYRSTLDVLATALREFAPNTVFALENADVNVHVEGLPPLELSSLALQARTDEGGVELHASAASPYWTTMQLAGRIRYSDLSSTAELHLARVQGQAWLDWLLKSSGLRIAVPDADLNLRFSGDAAKALALEVDGTAQAATLTRGAQRLVASPLVLKAKLVADASDVTLQVSQLGMGASGLDGGVLHYTPKEDAIGGEVGYRLDLAQALGYARELAPDALGRIESASGSLRGRIRAALRGEERRLTVSVEQSDAALGLADLPGPIGLKGGAAVDIDSRIIKAERVAVSLRAGELVVANANYRLKDGAAGASVQFDLDLAQTLALVRGALPEERRGALDGIESASGHLRGNAKAQVSGSAWTAALELVQSDAQAKLRGLPAPVTLAGAALRATPKMVSVERARVTLLDSSATASAKISDFDKGPRIEGVVAEALVGAKLLDWVWQTAKIAPGFEPKTPIRLSLPRLGWAPKAPLELKGSARFDAGAALAVDVAWSPGLLDVRSATIKDQRSDASVALRSKGAVIEGKYAGTLDSRSIAALLKGGIAQSGALSGELRFRFDRAQPERTSAEGSLKGENLDLTWLAGKPAKVSHIDVSADNTGLKIGEAALEWAGQRATLRGTAKPGEKGPVIDAEIDSPGVLVDALLPEKPKEPAKPAAADPAAEKKKTEKAPVLWPLPVTGKIALRSEFLQYTHLKLAPVAATLVMEENRAHLDLTQGRLCGIAVPFTFEATPKGFAATTKLSATKQPIEQTAKCLSDEKVQISGLLDMTAALSTEGKLDELVKNLGGTVNADLRNGQVMKFALIGNILSMKNVVALASQGGPKLGSEGFPFRQLSARGHFEKGTFVLEEGVFHSNAVGLGANGWISLADYQSNLTVLVAPLALLDEAVRKLPVLGYIAGGSFTSLPVAVRGDIRDPTVVPLGPGAITKDLMGIFTRTLSLPGKLAPADTPQR